MGRPKHREAREEREQIPADARNDWRVLGIDNAGDDFQEEDGYDLFEEFDHDDLVRQYKEKKKSAHELAAAAVTAYLQKVDRAGDACEMPPSRGVFFGEYGDELGVDERGHASKRLVSARDQPDAGAEAAYQEWRAGYEEGLALELANHILDVYAESLSESVHAATQRLKRNPRGPFEGMEMWTETGRQDSGNTFDEDTLEYNEIDLDDYAPQVLVDGKVDSNELNKVAQMVTNLLRDRMAVDYKDEWLEHNEGNVVAEGHSPTDAYHAWLNGFVSAANPWIRKWIEERALEDEE